LALAKIERAREQQLVDCPLSIAGTHLMLQDAAESGRGHWPWRSRQESYIQEGQSVKVTNSA